MFNNDQLPPGFIPDRARGGDGRAGLAWSIRYLLLTGFSALIFYLVQDVFTLGVALLALLIVGVLAAAVAVPVLIRRNRQRKEKGDAA
jgi:Flp pilus assembly protein TadB